MSAPTAFCFESSASEKLPKDGAGFAMVTLALPQQPMTLMKHHVRRRRVESLAAQVYLDPHPRELSLCNHV